MAEITRDLIKGQENQIKLICTITQVESTLQLNMIILRDGVG